MTRYRNDRAGVKTRPGSTHPGEEPPNAQGAPSHHAHAPTMRNATRTGRSTDGDHHMRRLTLPLTALLLSIALAAGAPATQGSVSLPTGDLSINTRVAILENRVDRLQASLDDLRTVPSQLATIDEKLRTLADRSKGNSDVFVQLAELVVSNVLIGGIAFAYGSKRQSN